MVLTMATASTFIGSSVTAALTMHIPIRGRSLRDRIRPRPQTHHRGWRLTPGTHSSLTSTELIALVDDTPTPIRALTCHNVEYQLDGEIGHHYARYEQRFGIQREHWSHLCVEADRHSDLEALASFLQHRLHLLGPATGPRPSRNRLQPGPSSPSGIAPLRLRRTSIHRHPPLAYP